MLESHDGIMHDVLGDDGRIALRDALLRHQPADDEERTDLAAILALVEAEPRCFDRTFYLPGHVTGSAFVVDAASGGVLLHHHARLGRWLQVGGHDAGERDAYATALREAREESGLVDLRPLSTAILDVDVHRIPAGRGEPEHLHHDVRYALVTARPESIIRSEAESTALAWFALDDAVARLAEPGAERALHRLARLIT